MPGLWHITTWHCTALAQTGGVGFREVSASWLLPVLAAAAVVCALLFYRGVSLEKRWRWVLTCTRALVLIIILAMLFQPVWIAQASTPVLRYVLVLLDVSESMAMSDQREQQRDRAEVSLALREEPTDTEHLQVGLGRLWRTADDATRAATRQQWADLESSHRRWSEALAALSREVGLADKLHEPLRQWETQNKSLTQSIERLAVQAELTPKDWAEVHERFAIWLGEADAALTGVGEAELDSATVLESTPMPSRLALAHALLRQRQSDMFTRLEEQHEVRYFRFGDRLDPTSGEELAPRQSLLAAEAIDQTTQLGTALEEAVAQHAGRAIAGVVLLTDGGSNQGLDPLVLADQLGMRGVRVFPVGLGLPAPPDVAVVQLVAPPVAFVRDRVPLQVQLSSAGFAERRVSLTARLDNQVVAQEDATLRDGMQWVELPFEARQTIEAGRLEVTVTQLDGEVSHANNQRQQMLKVTDEKIQVLYVEGSPRWEFRYLRQILLRDHRLNLHLLMTEGDRELAASSDIHLSALPSDPRALFEYDLVILGDVPASYFRQEQLEMLATLVRERGGSLVMIAGQQHAPHSYAETPLEAVLPARLGGGGFVAVEDEAYWHITAAGRRSALTRLAPDDDTNSQVWQRIRPMVRLPNLQGLKPGGTALATLADSRLGTEDDPYPLVSWHRYGSGRAMLVASDSVWRLRFRHGDEHHARFWGQAIQFLTLARIMGDAKRVQISTDATEYRAGQRVRVSAHVLGESYEPLHAEEYLIELEQRQPQQGRRTLTLKSQPGSPGYFEASFLAEAGEYRLSDPSQAEHATTATIQVTESSLEMIAPNMHEGLLREVARRSGGRYTPVAELASLPELLKSPPQTVLTERERDLWNRPWLLILLGTLLGFEWFVRRKMQQL